MVGFGSKSRVRLVAKSIQGDHTIFYALLLYSVITYHKPNTAMVPGLLIVTNFRVMFIPASLLLSSQLQALSMNAVTQSASAPSVPIAAQSSHSPTQQTHVSPQTSPTNNSTAGPSSMKNTKDFIGMNSSVASFFYKPPPATQDKTMLTISCPHRAIESVGTTSSLDEVDKFFPSK